MSSLDSQNLPDIDIQLSKNLEPDQVDPSSNEVDQTEMQVEPESLMATLIRKATNSADRHRFYQSLNRAGRGFPPELCGQSVQGFPPQLFTLLSDTDPDLIYVHLEVPPTPTRFESNTLTAEDAEEIITQTYWDLLELDPLPIHEELIQAAYKHNNLIAVVILEQHRRSNNPKELLQYLDTLPKYRLFRWYHIATQTFKGLPEAFQLLPPVQKILFHYMGDTVNMQLVIPMHPQVRDYFGNEIPTAGSFADRPAFTGDLCQLEAPLDPLNTTMDQQHILLKDHAKTYCVKLGKESGEPVYYIDENDVVYYIPEYHYKQGKMMYKSDLAKILASPGGDLKEGVLRTMFYVNF